MGDQACSNQVQRELTAVPPLALLAPTQRDSGEVRARQGGVALEDCGGQIRGSPWN